MIVGLLAMLFIIVAAYITLARSERQASRQYSEGEQIEKILDTVNRVVLSTIRSSMDNDEGRPFSGGESASERAAGQQRIFSTPGAAGILFSSGYSGPGQIEQVTRPVHFTRSNYSLETIPGARGSEWLASISPVPTVGTGTVTDRQEELRGLGRVVYPAVSNFNGRSAPTTGTPLSRLFRDYLNGDEVQGFTEFSVRIDPTLPLGVPANADLVANTKEVFQDADGDGVPDSDFAGCAPLTQVANAMAGAPLVVPGLDNPAFSFSDRRQPALASAAALESAGAEWRVAENFENNALYEVAAKVIAHGGLVSLDSPPGQTAGHSNREFTLRMFQWLMHESDVPPISSLSTLNNDEIFRRLHQQAAAIEPLLRRRGGRLRNQDLSTSPQALRALSQEFPYTFVRNNLLGGVGGAVPLKADNWQRFNLANYSGAAYSLEWHAWQLANMPDAVDYVAATAPVQRADVMRGFARRGEITTISYSDDLARDLSPTIPPEPTASAALPLLERQIRVAGRVGVEPGELKFYLGDLCGNTSPVDPGFAGLFTPGSPVYDPLTSDRVFAKLARYFTEMLSAHGDWTDYAPERTAYDRENMTLTRQASMLAVNTMAFATPRWPRGSTRPGYIDVVSAVGRDGNRYFGYAPQPFITEVIVYRHGEAGAGATGRPNSIALAIELFNPNDPGGYDPNDPIGSLANPLGDDQAIWLPQFGISINDGPIVQLVNNAESGARPFTVTGLPVVLPTQPRLGGRQFMTVFFENATGPGVTTPQSGFFQSQMPGAPSIVLSDGARLAVLDAPVRPPPGPGVTREGPDPVMLTVRLWRGRQQGLASDGPLRVPPLSPVNPRELALVDEFRLPTPEFYEPRLDPPGPPDPNDAYDPPTNWSGAFTQGFRDMTPSHFDSLVRADAWGVAFGKYGPGGPNAPMRSVVVDGSSPGVGVDSWDDVAPRWRCVSTKEIDDTYIESGTDRYNRLRNEPLFDAARDTGPEDNGERPILTSLNHPDPRPQVPSPSPCTAPRLVAAPQIPLFSMNAEAGIATNIHGMDRPNSFPTVGFMLYVSRYSHLLEYPFDPTIDPDTRPFTPLQYRPLTRTHEQEFFDRNYTLDLCAETAAAAYPHDFGHMPILRSRRSISPTVPSPDQETVDGGYFDDNRAGRVPWGMLVFDYFTTYNPALDGDPYRVPGRIDVNAASWYVLAGLPVIGPNPPGPIPGEPRAGVETLPAISRLASPTFWDGAVGGLLGFDEAVRTHQDPFNGQNFFLRRFPSAAEGSGAAGWRPTLLRDAGPGLSPAPALPIAQPAGVASPTWHLGPQLACALTSYRDRLPTIYLSSESLFDTAHNRTPDIRPDTPTTIHRGFVTLGELLAVPGFDLEHQRSSTASLVGPLFPTGGKQKRDFMRTVSLLALLDTHFLTTRSNTFTAYVTVTNRRDPDKSIRSQTTFDRSNILPRSVQASDSGGLPVAVPVYSNELPRIIAEQQVSYLNARYDN